MKEYRRFARQALRKCKELYPKALSVLLILVLTLQSVMTDGLTVALAESISSQSGVYLLNAGVDGDVVADDPGGATSGGTTFDDPDAPDGAVPDGTTPDGAAPEGTNPGGTTPDGTNPDGTVPDGTTPDGDEPGGDAPDGSTPGGDEPGGDAPDGTAPDSVDKLFRTSLRAWEGDLDALSLDSDGFVFNYEDQGVKDAIKASIDAILAEAQAAVDQANAATVEGPAEGSDPSAADTDAAALLSVEGSEGVEGGEGTEGTENATDGTATGTVEPQLVDPALPESLPATLNLKFSLDPTKSAEAKSASNPTDGSVGTLASVVPGDTISVALPTGFSAPADAGEVNVFQLDESGNPTSVKIGTAVIQSGVIKVTFQQPTDTVANAEGTYLTYTVGEKNVSDDTPNLATLSASVDLAVLVSSSLVRADATTVTWTLQTEGANASAGVEGLLSAVSLLSGGRSQSVELSVPSKADVLSSYGFTKLPTLPTGASDAADALVPLANTEKWKETGRTPGSGDTTLTLLTSWCDSNNSHGLRPSLDYQKKDYKLTFSIDGTSYDFTLENAKMYLGMTEDQFENISIDFAEPGVGYTSATAEGLPSEVNVSYQAQQVGVDGSLVTDDNGKPLYDTETKTISVTWTLTDTKKGYYEDNNATVYKDYSRYTGTVSGSTPSKGSVSSNGAGAFEATQYLQVLQDVSYNLSLKVGDLKATDVLNSLGDSIAFRAYVNNELVDEKYRLSAVVNEGYLSYGDTSTEDQMQTVELSGKLPIYDAQNHTLVYRLSYENSVDSLQPYTNVDGYQVSYNNQASPNHGTATDGCYPGGTLFLTHVGSTTFDATKVWLDNDDAENRPELTFTLWRYSPGTEGTSQTASQVTDPSGAFVTVTVPAKSGDTDGSVSLGDLLKKQHPDLVLDKYDSDGYPFVYGLREQGSAVGYQAIYGSVDAATGAVTDTSPNYYNEEGNGTIPTEDPWTKSRPDTDRLIYNGGTLSNRRSGSVTVTQTKTWVIAAFQDQLHDVDCTFTLQQRAAGSDNAWETATEDGTTTGTPITKTLEGFLAESLTQTISGSYPKYGRSGEELEYRWVETNVTQGGKETDFEPDEATNTATFELSFELPEEGGTETLMFTSSVDDETGYIVNTFANTTEEYVDKYWQSEDGTYSQNRPDPRYFNTNATVKLFQDDTLVGTFTMTGETLLDLDFDNETDGYTIDGLADGDKVHVDETRSYHLEFTNLPKYSPTGHRYIYLILEENVDGWVSSRTYNADEHLTEIYNDLPVGEGSEGAVTKKWIDGDDAQHRLNSVVGVYAARDMASQTLNADGTPRTSYQEGELITTVLLSEENAWYAEFGVGIGSLTHDDFNFVELGLTEGASTDVDSITFPSMTKEQAEEKKESAANQSDWNWVNDHWANDNLRIATDEHVYEVGDSTAGGYYDENKDAYTVTNRRVGLIDLDVTKTWYDTLDNIDDDTSNPRPNAQLVLSCTSHENVFSFDEDGNLCAQLENGNTLVFSVVDEKGNPVSGISIREDDTVIIPVDSKKRESEYHIVGLPKYGGQGLLASYSLTEEWVGDNGEYSTSGSVGSYEVGNRHYQDVQKYEFSNRRTGTRDVTFNKEWKDVYVKETLGQRPDIYLTLYKASAETNYQLVAVQGYIDYLWTANDSNQLYSQSCTISGLPKYDSLGGEITYFATESMSSTGSTLDYVPVTFSFTGEGAPTDGDTYAWDLAANDKITTHVALDDVSGSSIALREGGTFTNKLEGNVKVEGEKLWQNVPTGFPLANLPEITIFLQQRVAGDNWPDLYVKVESDGTVTLDEERSPGGAVASTTLKSDGSGTLYTYSITSSSDDGEFPRYTANGELIEYRAREVMGGLAGKPGSVTAQEFENTNFASDDYTPTDGKVYTIAHGIAGSFKINNIYESDKGSLTVKKIFDGRSENDEYPDVTYTVQRRCEHQTGDDDWQYVTEHTITAAEFATSDDGSGNSTLTYTFEGLDVYAPDGTEWTYRIVETGIGGYVTYAASGNLTLDQTKAQGAKTDVVSDLKAAPIETDQATGKPTGNYDTTPDATFANVYEPDSATLTGTKIWDDYNNAFGLRPGSDALELTLTRKSQKTGQTETLFEGKTIASNETFTAVSDGKSITFEWTATESTGKNWTYKISGDAIEQYAPDGSPWQYTLEEKSINSDYYRARTSVATAQTTDTGNFSNLVNVLKGSAQVVKIWDDGDDRYGLRPTSVTVQLQARVMDGGDASTEGWKNANSALADYVTDFDDLTTESTLDARNVWRNTWDSLPTVVKNGGFYYAVEYRVIETKIGDVDVTIQSNADEDSLYSNRTVSYTTSQKTESTTTSSDSSRYTTKITNTLEPTSVSITKRWNDSDNTWSSRPTSSTTANSWSVKYYLMSKVDSQADYSFVPRAGQTFSGPDPLEDASFESKVVKVTLEAGMDDDSLTETLENLPKYDASGNEIHYAWAEEVPFGYTVSGGRPLGTNPTGHEVVLVASSTTGTGTAPSQTYDNVLDTVQLEGTKLWNDYDTNFTPTFDGTNVPTLTLYRQIAGGQDQSVTQAADPTWSEATTGNWTFTYTNLPKTDTSGNPYTYWAVETEGSGASEGFYPTYGTAGSAGSQYNPANETWTNTEITNVATRFTLEKTDDSDPAQTLNGIQLSVMSQDKSTVYAVWERDASGTVSSWVNPAGVALTHVKDDDSDKVDTSKLYANGFTKMSTDQAGYVIGLKADTYVVTETGDIPENHAPAEDVKLTIASNGKVSTNPTTALTTTEANPGVDSTITVTLVDPVFRAYIELTKTFTGGAVPVSGAEFSLYQQVGTDPDPDHDTLVAKGIVTGTDGKWSSKEEGKSVNFEIGYATDGRTHLSDGLLPGTYYFVETDFPDTVYEPAYKVISSSVTIAPETDHGTTSTFAMDNTAFSATVTLKKYDATSGEAIDGAVFKLEKSDGSGNWQLVKNFTTDSNGLLTVNVTSKGTYRLSEDSNEGYDVSNPFTATFEIENKDHGNNYDLTTSSGQTAVSYQYVSGTNIVESRGVPNTRKTGEVTMFKTSSVGGVGGLNGAVFTLQRKDGENWIDVVAGLETGKTYSLNGGNTQATEEVSATTSTGYLVVKNLLWGTYRFYETSSSEGYVLQQGTTSNEFTIGRTSLSANLTGTNAVKNVPTRLVIQKKDGKGNALTGATFTVTPQEGSSFVNGTTTAMTLTPSGTSYVLADAQLKVDNTYDIVETSAPKGYTAIQGTLTVKVENDGTLSIVGNAPAGYKRATGSATEANKYTFVATDTPITLQLVKTGENGSALAGATFVLDGPCSDNRNYHEFKCDTNGTCTIEGKLVNGNTYTVYEKAAPRGYKVFDGEVEFTVDAAGRAINVSQPTSGAFKVVNDNQSGTPVIKVTLDDEPIELVLGKVSQDGKNLSGAVFSVTPETGSTFADGTAEPKSVTTSGAAGTAPLTAQLVCGGTYVIAETSAPAGYELVTSNLTIKVNDMGEISIVGTPPSEWRQVTDNEFHAVLTDTPIEAQVGKVSLSTGLPLSGAEFTVTGEFANGSQSRTLTTDDTGVVSFNSADLVGGKTYTITETKAPEGYELIKVEWQFKVETDGTLTAVSDPADDGVPGYRITDNNLQLTGYDEPIVVTLEKTGDEGNPLGGATFEVTGHFAGTTAVGKREFTTAAPNGELTIDAELVAGETYKLVEVDAPSSYELIQGTLTFSVDEDGTIEVVGSAPTGYSVGDDGVTISAVDTPIEVRLLKTNEVGKKLPNAEFSLYEGEAAEGTPVQTLTSNDTEAVDLSVGRGQTYTLVETKAPNGYYSLGNFTFTVNDNGTITPKSEVAGYSVAVNPSDPDVIVITAKDTSIPEPPRHEVTLTKVDVDGQALVGATFTVEGKFDNGETTREYALTEAASVTIDGLIAGETYTISEKSAPSGYEALGSFSFKVLDDGTIEAVSSVAEEGMPGYVIDESKVGVTVRDKLIDARIVKVDTEGNTLAAASFEIQGAFSNGAERVIVTVGSDGAAAIMGLVAGQTYTVRETKAPEGYELIEGSWTFTVAEDGTLTGAGTTDGTAAGFKLDGNAALITAVDVKTPEEPPTPPDEPSEPPTTPEEPPTTPEEPGEPGKPKEPTEPTVPFLGEIANFAPVGIVVLGVACLGGAYLMRKRKERSE